MTDHHSLYVFCTVLLPVRNHEAAVGKPQVTAIMGNFVAEMWTYLALDILVVFLRLFARVETTGWKGLAPDDYLMLFAIVSCLSLLDSLILPPQFCFACFHLILKMCLF